MKKIIILNKKEGETPLAALEAFRKKNKAYKDVPMTYAGRLDPMASGVLLILAGKETKQKEKYLVLPKEYEFEVLFGFATDTYDILGKVIAHKKYQNTKVNFGKQIKDNLKYFTGKFIQSYPAYSSKTVNGKALFAYARAGEVVEAPTREVEVKKITLTNIKTISSINLLSKIEKRIGKVEGDFRQAEILAIWQKNLGTMAGDKFFVGSFVVACSSGTYVRGIANSLGERIGIPALAYSITRTRLGKWSKLK